MACDSVKLIVETRETVHVKMFVCEQVTHERKTGLLSRTSGVVVLKVG